MRKSKLMMKILQYLYNQKREVPARTITREVYAISSANILNGTVKVDTHRALKTLMNNGYIEKDKSGYRLTDMQKLQMDCTKAHEGEKPEPISSRWIDQPHTFSNRGTARYRNS